MLKIGHRNAQIRNTMLQIRPPCKEIVDLGGVGMHSRYVVVQLDTELFHGGRELVHVLLHGGIHGLDLHPSLTKTAGLDELRQISRGGRVVAGL